VSEELYLVKTSNSRKAEKQKEAPREVNPFAQDSLIDDAFDLSTHAMHTMDDEVDAAMNEAGDDDDCDDDDDDNDDEEEEEEDYGNDEDDADDNTANMDVAANSMVIKGHTHQSLNKQSQREEPSPDAVSVGRQSPTSESLSDASSPNSPGLDASEMASLHKRNNSGVLPPSGRLKRSRSAFDSSSSSDSDDNDDDDDFDFESAVARAMSQ